MAQPVERTERVVEFGNYKRGTGNPNTGNVYGEPGWVYQDDTTGAGKLWLCTAVGLGNWIQTGVSPSGTVNGYATATNDAGDTTITPASENQTVLLTVGGVARTSNIILDVAGRTIGDRLAIPVILPATADIVLAIRNATAGGTLLLPAEVYPTQDLTTDGNILSWFLEFVFDGAAWIYMNSKIPA